MVKRAKPTTIISASVGLAAYLLERGLDMAGVTLSLGWAVVLWIISGLLILFAAVVGFKAYMWPTLRTIRIVMREGGEMNKQSSFSNEVKLDKLGLVRKAIIEAKEITPNDKDVTVYITDANGLKQIFSQELKSILDKLQDEKKLKLKTFPEWLLPELGLSYKVHQDRIRAIADPSRNNFTVRLLGDLSKPDKEDSPTE